jgi:glycosyltransferase involved in cell wall biosynthesis
MRIISFGGFIDYQIQLANALSKKNTVMLVIPANKLPEEFTEIIDERVNLFLLGEAVQQFKIGRKRKAYNALNPKGRSIFGVKINCETASGRWKPLYHPISLLIFKDFLEGIREFKPDVIHIQNRGELLFWLFAYPLIGKPPVVCTFHDVKIHLGEESIRLRVRVKLRSYFATKYSDQIIVHGEKLKEQMIKEYSIQNEKVHAIPIGEHEVAPFKKYEREDIKEDGNLILFFGRIWEYKGLEYLIKAEPMITKEVPNAKVIIAGAGEDFKKYESMMINRDNFIVHNYRIPYKEGAELFQGCSVVALPYIDASQSGVIPTAYGFKKPVVVTDVGAIPEIVDNGITGFIVPPKNPEALAEAIIKLLKDEKIRKQMGENAYKKLKTDLSWDNIAAKTIEVYKKAIDEFRKGGLK